MSYFISGYLLSLFLAIFISSWRLAFIMLGIQSLLCGIFLFGIQGTTNISTEIQLVDLLLIRSVLIPAFFIHLLKKQKIPAEFDVIPPNIVVWTFAIILILTSYWFAQTLFSSNLWMAGIFGTANSGLLIGLFILANQKYALGQIIGLLTFETGIVLSEIIIGHHEHWSIQLGLTFVFAWTILLFFKFQKEFTDSSLEAHESNV